MNITQQVEKSPREAFMAAKTNKAWTTETEIGYLKTIGDNYPVLGKTKGDFLLGYIKGAFMRIEWRGIDKNKVIAYAEALLAAA